MNLKKDTIYVRDLSVCRECFDVVARNDGLACNAKECKKGNRVG